MHCAHCSRDYPATVRYCPECGLSLVATAPGSSMERRYATILFADLTGYTALTETSDPEDVAALVERLRAVLSPIVEAHGGIVNQFVGDEVMAVFGLPVAHRDDARIAVRTALRLHAAMNTVMADSGLALHCGIASGLVVARRADTRAGAWTLTGDAVNVAARLRSLAGPHELLVNSDCWQQVAPYFAGTSDGPIEVKGREMPVVPYRVFEERVGGALSTGPLYGRDAECAQLTARLDDCVGHRRGGAALIAGEAGIGKSRLAQEILLAARDRGFDCHAAIAYDFGATRDDEPLVCWTRSLLGMPAAGGESLRATLSALIERSPVGPSLSFALYELAALEPPAEVRAMLAALDAEGRIQTRRAAFLSLLRGASAAAPQLLFLDDFHNADRSLVREMQSLIDIAGDIPLVVLATMRTVTSAEEESHLPALRGASHLALGALPVPAARDMADAIAGDFPPAGLIAAIERANGNPLFLEQLLRNSTLTLEGRVPGTVLSLVQSRIDELSEHDRHAVQVAAILGLHWSLAALRDLIREPGYDPAPLVEHAFVRSDESGFVFRHGLLRDGAYASILSSTRRALHTRAAEWFSSRSETGVAAEHFERADDPRAAAAYLDASMSAASRFQFERALVLADKGLEINGVDSSVRCSLFMARAGSLTELGRVTESIESASTAHDLTQDARVHFDALLTIAAGMRLTDQIDAGLAALDTAESDYSKAVGAGALARLHHLRGNLLFPSGRAGDCLREHSRALELARSVRDNEAEANALSGLGDAYFLEGRMRSANTEFRRTVTLAKAHGYLRIEVATTQIVGWTAHFLLEFDEAAAQGRAAVDLARRVVHLRAELIARSMLFWVEAIMRNNPEFDESYAGLNIELAQQLGAKRFEAQAWMARAMLGYLRGSRGSALANVGHALAICREHGMGYVGPFAYAVQALIEPTPEACLQSLMAGEAELARGCVSHNHLYLHALGIDAMLSHCEWERAARHCECLLAVTAGEFLPWSDFVVARGRALLRHGRGERSSALDYELRDLITQAQRIGYSLALPQLLKAVAQR